MIARWWRGWTASPEATEAYEELLRTTIFPAVRSHAGCRGTYLLRRDREDGGAEFATLTLWDSWDAVRGFAGDDYEVAVVPDAARAVLERFDERSAHYEVVEGSGD
jgi:heme-degrading monooxygenase HmoA